MKTMILFAVLATVTMMVNHVKALTFLETKVLCTNNNDGLLSPTIYLESGNCMTTGATSIDNGCTTGTFNSYNSTNCSGSVIQSVPRDTCVTLDVIKVIYRCSSYNDAEYLRQILFQTADGHSANDCSSTLKVTLFSRLNVCYPGNQPGSLGFKYEKANATALRTTAYNDAACNSVNRTQEVNADGTCQGSSQTDFVNANLLGNSATAVGKSAWLLTAASILGVALLL